MPPDASRAAAASEVATSRRREVVVERRRRVRRVRGTVFGCRAKTTFLCRVRDR
nr:hypothetical protein JVH1_1887 [Rhodococcus sp. JVH1]